MADEFDELLGNVKPKKASSRKGKSGRRSAKGAKLKTYPRTNPDDLSETVRVDRNDPRFDEWLTPSQARAAKKREGKASGAKSSDGSVVDTIANEVKKELKKKLNTRTRSGRKERAKITKGITDFVTGPGGKKLAKGLGAVGVVGVLGGTLVKTLSMAKTREKAYRLADAALARQVEAARKAGKPMSSQERTRLQVELRRAYITQLEEK